MKKFSKFFVLIALISFVVAAQGSEFAQDKELEYQRAVNETLESLSKLLQMKQLSGVATLLQYQYPQMMNRIDTVLKNADIKQLQVPEMLLDTGLKPLLSWEYSAMPVDMALYSLFTATDLGVYENLPPYEPSNPNPSDGASNVALDTSIQWTGGDPDPADTVTYDVYFGTVNPPADLVVANHPDTTYTPANQLDPNTTYYWKIVARDDSDAETEGPVWSFTTLINYPPNEPVNPIPPDGASDVYLDADLLWQCNDPNPGDTLEYDVYFGNTSPPPLVVENIPDQVYDPGTLAETTTYYWKIVARDSHQAETEGPIWSFTTGLDTGPTPTPTQGPDPCDEYAVQLDMGTNYFCPGDICYLDARICNPEEPRYLPLFIILDIASAYWYAPGWTTDVDYYLEVIPSDWSTKEILPAFVWPEIEGAYSGIIFWGALTSPDMSTVLGEFDMYVFGYGSCY